MPNVDLPPIGKAKAKLKQPTDAEKATIYVALLTATDDAKLAKVKSEVIGPIFDRLDRPVPAKPGQLNNYAATIKKAVKANNQEVIQILRDAGITVTDNQDQDGEGEEDSNGNPDT